MDQVQPEKLSLTSEDVTARRVVELRALIPEAFAEDRLDLDKLKAALGDVADPQGGREPYGLTWPGKVEAIRAIQSPSIGTLKPDRDRSVDFDATGNVFIEGDNLEVLKLLQKSYYGRVKMIYIDPPYNTGKEFIYPDKFKEGLRDYLEFSKQVRDGVRLASNAETEGRFHSNWLSMMYPRLFLGMQLLREDGFIVVSIDDAEVHNLRAMLNEAMGENNFIACLVWDRNRKNDAKFFSVGHEYMLVYAKNKSYLTENKVILRVEKEGIDEVRKKFDELRAEHGEDYAAIQAALREFYATIDEEDSRFPMRRFNKVDPKGPYRDDRDISWPGSGGPTYRVLHPTTGKPCKMPSRGWVFPKAIAEGRVVFGADETTVPAIRTNLFDKTTQVMRSVDFSYAQTASREFDKLFNKKRVFDNPKHYADLARLVEYLTGEDDVIVDYFAGSASIGHAVYDVNSRTGSRRTFVCVQLPEPVNQKKTSGKNAVAIGLKTIADVGRARLLKVIEQEQAAANSALHGNGGADLGFKYLTLDSSNFRIWDNEEAGAEGAKGAKTLMEYMAEHVNNILAGASEESILFEILIKSGTDLAARREAVEVAGKRIWRINGGALIVCLADSVTLDTMRGIAALEPKPRRVICLDRCFASDDALKTNTVLEMRSHEIHFLTVEGDDAMKFQFEANQDFQLDAIRSIVDLFDGQPREAGAFATTSFREAGRLISEFGVGNGLVLADGTLLDNLRAVQERNDLPVSAELATRDFTVEMETGTGKTYVYLRTILELNARYGWTKFVIVVPGVPIREGVQKSVKDTDGHFSALYGNVPRNTWVYQSKDVSRLRGFATANTIQILIINIAAFDKPSNNVIYVPHDKLGGHKPIEFLQATQPIVIIDEPQNVEGEQAKKALATLNPLFTLRYSATHRNLYNLTYKLDPVRAYDLKLVKRIEVDSVLEEADFNKPFIRVDKISGTKTTISAKLTIDIQQSGGPARKTVTVSQNLRGQWKNRDLFTVSKGRDAYHGHVVESIDAGGNVITLSNGVSVTVGRPHGARTDDMARVRSARQSLSIC